MRRKYYRKSDDLLHQVNGLAKTISKAKRDGGVGFAIFLTGFIVLAVAAVLYFLKALLFFWIVLAIAIILIFGGAFFALKEKGLILEKCPICKSKTVKRNGRYGEYVCCIKYSEECDYTRSLK